MPLPDPNPNHRGIQAMSLAMGSFVVNDALVKYVSESMSGAQLILIRGVFATLLLLGVAAAMGQLKRPPHDQTLAGQAVLKHPLMALLSPLVMTRAALDAMATLAYLTALFHMPIGNATAINMATPLIITLYAVIALREPVNAVRWLALVVGFSGVVLVVQPNAEGFNVWALLCLLGTLFHTARDVLTRSIPASVPSLLIGVATSLTVCVFAAIWCLAQGWQPVGLKQFTLLAAAGVCLSGGYFFIILSMRSGQMSVIAPFRYTGLLFALVLGWLVWGEAPNLLAWAGIAMLVGSGLYVLRAAAPGPTEQSGRGGQAVNPKE